ncbi:MAG: hypothetical protein NXI31_27300 [bacterium]|nr:hypothetical protein [bacterium]
MDMLILGELMAHASTGGGTTVLEGYWMPAGGNDGVAGAEVFFASAASAFTIKMETKSSDAADSSVTTIGSATVSSVTPGVTKFDVADARDLVRYVVESSHESDAYLHFQLSQPLWAPN